MPFATGLVARGSKHAIPGPKRSKARWGNADARTPWWSGYWKNGDLGLGSMAQLSASGGWKVDVKQPG